MKKEILPLGFNLLSYDEFTWSDNDRASSQDFFLLSVPISKEHLKKISRAIYQNYFEIVRDVPDYFDIWDEPFPNDEYDVYNNPTKLFIYFSKSSLWSDFLIRIISEIQNWDMCSAQYHVFNVYDVNELNNSLYIIMKCLKIKESPLLI